MCGGIFCVRVEGYFVYVWKDILCMSGGIFSLLFDPSFLQSLSQVLTVQMGIMELQTQITSGL